MAAINKAGLVFVLQRDTTSIKSGALQSLEITQTFGVGDFLGIPVYDPLTNQIYFGNPQDDTRVYQHGLAAVHRLRRVSLAFTVHECDRIRREFCQHFGKFPSLTEVITRQKGVARARFANPEPTPLCAKVN